MSSGLRKSECLFTEAGLVTDAYWCPSREAFFLCKPETSSVISVNAQGEVLCRWHFVEPVYFIRPAQTFHFVLGCQSGLVRWQVDTHQYTSLGIPHSEGVHSKLVSGEIDSEGNLWFLRLDVGEKLSIGGLYCASNDHSAQLMETGFSRRSTIRCYADQVSLFEPATNRLASYQIQRGFVQFLQSDDVSQLNFPSLSEDLVYEIYKATLHYRGKAWLIPGQLSQVGLFGNKAFALAFDPVCETSSLYRLDIDMPPQQPRLFSA